MADKCGECGHDASVHGVLGCYVGVNGGGRCSCKGVVSGSMPEVLAGDVVDLSGHLMRPALSNSLRDLQNNDGVRAIYRRIWKRVDA